MATPSRCLLSSFANGEDLPLHLSPPSATLNKKSWFEIFLNWLCSTVQTCRLSQRFCYNMKYISSAHCPQLVIQSSVIHEGLFFLWFIHWHFQYLEYRVPNEWLMRRKKNWKECWKKRSLPSRNTISTLAWWDSVKPRNVSIKIGVQTEIRTEHLQNTSVDRFC
jgi:hypothetical protein